VKNIVSILTILIFVFITLGCTGNQSNTQQSTQDNVAQPDVTTPVETPTSTSVETPVETPVETVTQVTDLWWVMDANKDCLIIGTDVENVGTDLQDISSQLNNSNNDFTKVDASSLATDGQKLIDDTNESQATNEQHTVSDKYTDAQNDWYHCLQDFNKVGSYCIAISNDIKNNDQSQATDDLNQCNTWMSYGMEFFHDVQRLTAEASKQRNLGY